MGDFLTKNKISKLYSYKEVYLDEASIEYGWVESDDIDLSGDIVVAYHSKTKKATASESSWSELEGNSAARLDDYKLYFFRSTGFQPVEFIDIYKLNKHTLYDKWAKAGNYSEDTVDFLYSLSNLLVNGKRFIHSGRGYKIINN
tara:strand:- start:4937 stop:5368 length:432 start_codon:yes stop_codon:yes gene_type:complete